MHRACDSCSLFLGKMRRGRNASRSIGGSIAATERTPITRMLGQRILGSQRFVDIDAKAGSLVDIHVTVPDLGTARKDLLSCLGKARSLLDSKIMNRQVEMSVARVTKWSCR